MKKRRNIWYWVYWTKVDPENSKNAFDLEG